MQRVLLLLAVLCIAAATVATAQQVGISVDWNAVSKTPTPKVLDGTIGKCICDLHATGCDPNCCCDSQCSDAMKTVAFKTCSQETVSWRSFVKCYDDSGARKISYSQNQQYLDSRVPGESGVCLMYDNFENDIAMTFTVPPALEENTIVTPQTNDWYTGTDDVTFRVGSLVPMVRSRVINGEIRQIVQGTGYVTLTVPGRGGQCVSDKAAEFMKPIDFSRCVFKGTLSDICSQASTEPFMFAALAGPNFALSALVPVKVNVYSADTGSLLGTVDPTSSFSSSTPTTPTIPPTLQTALNALGSVCKNAVTGSSLTVEYDYPVFGIGRIVNASYNLWVTDLSVANPTSISNSLVREAVVVFKNFNAASPPSLRKGTPGYVAKDSLNVGTALSDSTLGKAAVEQRLFGLELPTGRLCSSRQTKEVTFFQDVLESGCGLDITESELQTLCASGTGTLAILQDLLKSTSFVRTPLSISINTTGSGIVDRVGRTADADPTNPLDWVPIRGFPLSGTSAVIYQNTLRRCDNLVTGLHYTFVVGRAGVEYNPQDIIVGAKVEPIIGSWAFRPNLPLGSSSETSTTTSRVQLTFKVSFIRYNDQVKSRRVVPPRVLPEVADDVFYPFRYPDSNNKGD